MADDLKRITVFIGSPGDVRDERERAREIIKSLARDPLMPPGFTVEPVMWDCDAYQNNAARTPQQNIIHGLARPSDCDMAVFLFWSRIGSTLTADSVPDDHRDTLGFGDVPLTGSVWELCDSLKASSDSPDHVTVWMRSEDNYPRARLASEKEALRWQQDGVDDLFFAARPDDASFQRSVTDYNRDTFEKTLRDQVAIRIRDIANARVGHADAADETSARVSLQIPEAYIEWLSSQCSEIPLLGLTAPDVNPADLLHRVYVPAVTPARRAEPNPSDEDAHARELDGPTFDTLLSRLNESSLYVQGGAGSGKSTFCKWLCLTVASSSLPTQSVPTPDDFPAELQESFPEGLRGYLPVLCRLRELCDHIEWKPGTQQWLASDIEQALAAWLAARTQGLHGARLADWLSAGRVLLVLDGFDEVPHSKGKEGQLAYPRDALLSGLAAALPGWQGSGNRVLLTSRPYGLSPQDHARLSTPDARLPEAALAPLPDEMQLLFVERWFRVVKPDEADALASRVRSAMAARDDLDELRDNPMMLTALCVRMLHGGEIPRDIDQLYDSLVDYVLHNRYRNAPLEKDPARRRLGVLAVGMHLGQFVSEEDTEPPADVLDEPRPQVSHDRAEGWLRSYHGESGAPGEFAAIVVLNDLVGNSGLLHPVGESIAEFHHLSVQDFLASERLWRNKADFSQYLRRFAAEPRWRRTFVFWLARLVDSGSLNQALGQLAPLVDQLSANALGVSPEPAFTFAECLDLAHSRGGVGDFAEPYRKACLTALRGVASPAVRARLFETLGRLGLDRRNGVGLDADGLPDIAWAHVRGGVVEFEEREGLGLHGGQQQVADFDLACFPVTNGQFQAFVDALDGYAKPEWWDRDIPGMVEPRWSLPNLPRETVSWFEAVAFCRWLSFRRGETIRLPADAEWQRAASPDGRTYPWGGNYEDGMANCNESLNGGEWYLARTTAVGLYPAGGIDHSGHVIYDLAGDVYEWCSDHVKVLNDRKRGRVVRGGSWTSRGVRSTYRGRNYGDLRNDDIGFRVARTRL